MQRVPRGDSPYPSNIDNTEEVSDHGTTYYFNQNKDIDPRSAICTTRSDEDFILLQNFEFVNYYGDQIISTVYKSPKVNDFTLGCAVQTLLKKLVNE